MNIPYDSDLFLFPRIEYICGYGDGLHHCLNCHAFTKLVMSEDSEICLVDGVWDETKNRNINGKCDFYKGYNK